MNKKTVNLCILKANGNEDVCIHIDGLWKNRYVQWQMKGCPQIIAYYMPGKTIII